MSDATNTALTTWDPNSGAALPAYLADAMGDLGTNILARQNVPSLSYEGKTWTIVKDGNKTKLQAQNSDGDMVPIPIMRCVILNFNPDRGRAYYPGTYNPAAATQPDCWSPDGKAPDDSSKAKQHSICNGCPQSIKGSKVENGEERVACGSHRMVAIAPAFDIAGDPLRLKIAVTSDYDKKIVDHGWFALQQYQDFLKSRGITHTALVVTKIKFDANTAYPKLLFALDRLLSPEEVAQVKLALASPKVAELLTEKWTAAGVDGVPKNDSDIKPWGLEGAYADGWVAHPDSAGWSYKGQEVLQNEELAKRYPEPEPPKLPVTQDPTPAAPAASVPSVPSAASVEPAAPAHDPIGTAVADGWVAHPDSPGWFYKGDVVIERDKLAAQYPETQPEPATAAIPVAPSAPAAPPTTVDPVTRSLEAAAADGWAVHPDNPAYYFKGSEVLPTDQVVAKYPTLTATAAPTPSTPAPAVSGGTGASPSSPVIPSEGLPPEVSDLLNKWAG